MNKENNEIVSSYMVKNFLSRKTIEDKFIKGILTLSTILQNYKKFEKFVLEKNAGFLEIIISIVVAYISALTFIFYNYNSGVVINFLFSAAISLIFVVLSVFFYLIIFSIINFFIYTPLNLTLKIYCYIVIKSKFNKEQLQVLYESLYISVNYSDASLEENKSCINFHAKIFHEKVNDNFNSALDLLVGVLMKMKRKVDNENYTENIEKQSNERNKQFQKINREEILKQMIEKQ